MKVGELTMNIDIKKVSEKLRVAAKHFNEMSEAFDEIDKVELTEVKELELDLEEVAKYIRDKLAHRGLFAARVPIEELIYILKLETEYMEENGFTDKLEAVE